MGIKKGEKRPWDIYKNKKEKQDKTITFRVTSEEHKKIKEIQRQQKLKIRDIFFNGLKKL